MFVNRCIYKLPYPIPELQTLLPTLFTSEERTLYLSERPSSYTACCKKASKIVSGKSLVANDLQARPEN
jgi:hypothetical protein